MAKQAGPGVQRPKATGAGIACWCGNTSMDPFSEDYGVCRDCGTLVLLRADPPGRKPEVVDDDTDFYGKQYWLQHQEGDLGNPDIHARARNDLPERNLHWLASVLRYKLPGARTLELGCGNGSFVALMQLAGFEAAGAEMSPWVVEFGRRTFGAKVLVGPVEELDVPPGSLDAILMMDVLEHLPEPGATLRRCLELLKKDGVLFIQTPRYREGTTHAAMLAGDPFLEQLKPEEHLYLFTERGARKLLQDLGVGHVALEPAIFAHYDMFIVASRAKLATHPQAQVEAALLASPGGRIALALLDLRRREQALLADLAKAASDIEFLKGRIAEAEQAGPGEGPVYAQLDAVRNERNLLEAKLADLRGHFEASEADRAARGRVIEDQGQDIANLQAKVHEHLLGLAALTEKHSVLLADHAQVEERMNELRRDYATVVEDRAARSRVIDEHARTISSLQVQIDSRVQEAAGLRQQVEARVQEIAGLQQQLDARAQELDGLRRQFDGVEADRVARGKVIEDQGRRVVELESLVHETEQNRDFHRAEGERLAAELAAREAALGAQIAGLRQKVAEGEEHMRRIEARWWHRLGRRLRLM
jgi:2-polyprenyl-3-methyl-5-hydroxy-6-metoxy-1,4-benzoquinol methylase/uncharacterized coiled-coil DUF342 family protein